MKRRSCCLLLSVCFAGFLTGNARAQEKPNIILIMADDLGHECLGCYGGTSYQTPVLDRLAQQGMRFTHAYSHPLCTPSRVAIMTGKSNVRNYAAFGMLKPGERTFGNMLKEAGYTTAIAGKWQLYGTDAAVRGKGTLPQDAGFDNYCLWQVKELKERYWGPHLDIDGKAKQFPKTTFGPDVTTQYLLDFMENHRNRPFFVYYPMELTHDPFVRSPDSKGGSDQENFTGMVAYMDKLVGKIVDKVAALGLEKKTLILFTGDNGTDTAIQSRVGERIVRGGKASTTDAGTHAPLIACWPGTIKPGTTREDLIDFSDFYPTFAELAGGKLAGEIDGRSFLPQLHGGKGNPREWLFMYYCPRPPRTGPTRFARDQRWKLYGNGSLFDVQNDIEEKNPIRNEKPGSPAALARAKLEKALASMPAKGQSLMKLD